MLLVLGGLSAVPPLSFDMYLPGAAAGRGQPGRARGADPAHAVRVPARARARPARSADRSAIRAAGGARCSWGVGGYAVCSLACAFAPTAPALVVLRFLQGLGGGVAVVIARAIVRDREEGAAAARVFSLLMLVSGIAPIAAPLFGGLLIEVTSWRGIFVVLVAPRRARARRRLADPARDPRPREPSHRGSERDDPGRQAGRAQSPTHGIRAHRRVLVGSAVLLHLELVVRVPGHLRAHVDAVQPRVRGERGGSDGDRMAERHARSTPRALRSCCAGEWVRRWWDRSRCASCCGSDSGFPRILPALMVTVVSLPLVIPNATALASTPTAARRAPSPRCSACCSSPSARSRRRSRASRER